MCYATGLAVCFYSDVAWKLRDFAAVPPVQSYYLPHPHTVRCRSQSATKSGKRGVPGIMVAILGLRRSSGALDAAKLKVVFRIPGRRRRYLRMLSASPHPRLVRLACKQGSDGGGPKEHTEMRLVCLH